MCLSGSGSAFGKIFTVMTREGVGRVKTKRSTHPETEPDGIIQEGGAASPAATNPIPLPRASLSFLVKQPGGLSCRLHSKCSKCPPYPHVKLKAGGARKAGSATA